MLPAIAGKDRDALMQYYTDEVMCRIAALLPAARAWLLRWLSTLERNSCKLSSNNFSCSVQSCFFLALPFDCEPHKVRSALRPGRKRVEIMISLIFATELLTRSYYPVIFTNLFNLLAEIGGSYFSLW